MKVLDSLLIIAYQYHLMPSPNVQKRADIAGVILSQLCLVHCLLLPVFVGFLPSLSHGDHHHHHHHSFGGETFHLMVLILATPVALFALFQGYKQHGSTVAIKFGAAALALLWFVFSAEHIIAHDLVAALNVMGGLLMAWAHWQNWSFTKSKCSC